MGNLFAMHNKFACALLQGQILQDVTARVEFALLRPPNKFVETGRKTGRIGKFQPATPIPIRNGTDRLELDSFWIKLRVLPESAPFPGQDGNATRQGLLISDSL